MCHTSIRQLGRIEAPESFALCKFVLHLQGGNARVIDAGETIISIGAEAKEGEVYPGGFRCQGNAKPGHALFHFSRFS
jgi:hypothetical protein